MIATTRAELLRGGATDPLGDDVDVNTPVEGREGNFAISLVERSKGVQDAESGTWRSVSYVEGKVQVRLDIRDGDRLRDKRTGIVYSIIETTDTPRSLAGGSSTTLDLRQVGA